MKKVLVGGGAAVLAVAVGPAIAQVAPPPGVASGTSVAPGAPVPPARERVRVRVMSDRVMTRDDAVKHVRELFAKLDTNRDGVVTREEVDALHQKMASAMGVADGMQKRLAERGTMMGDRGAIFDRLDTNRDGNISRQEFMTGHAQMHEQRVMIMRNGVNAGPGMPGAHGFERMRMHGAGLGRGFGGHLFDRADTNRDGRLTLQEAETAALAHFDRADLNHDGRITPEERSQAHALRHQRRPS